MTALWRRQLADIVEENGEDAVIEALNGLPFDEDTHERVQVGEGQFEWWPRPSPLTFEEIMASTEALLARSRAREENRNNLQQARVQAQREAAYNRRKMILAVARGRENDPHLVAHVTARMKAQGECIAERTVRRYVALARKWGELR